jgi:DNA-binding response OmpR family regulator
MGHEGTGQDSKVRSISVVCVMYSRYRETFRFGRGRASPGFMAPPTDLRWCRRAKPMSLTSAEETTTVTAHGRGRNGDPYPVRVAIVSDSESLRDLVTRISREDGWIPVDVPADSIGDGVGASWNLVILDSAYRDLDLMRVAAAASRDTSHRVLVIAADMDPQLVADIINVGADDVLALPIEPMELRARMHSLVARSSASEDGPRDWVYIDSEARTISAGTMRLMLSQREWDVLVDLLGADETVPQTADVTMLRQNDGTSVATLRPLVSRIHDALDHQQIEHSDNGSAKHPRADR